MRLVSHDFSVHVNCSSFVHQHVSLVLAGASTGQVETLQYELYVPAGWQRTRRQKGSIQLAMTADAFATVAISMVAAVRGRVATPTLVVLPPQQPPVRGGTAWVAVSG